MTKESHYEILAAKAKEDHKEDLAAARRELEQMREQMHAENLALRAENIDLRVQLAIKEEKLELHNKYCGKLLEKSLQRTAALIESNK